MANIVRLESKPIRLEAIEWNNNEPEIRDFVKKDDDLKFRDDKLEVWNRETKTWENVPMFHYIVKGLKGEFYSLSPEIMERMYEVITEE